MIRSIEPPGIGQKLAFVSQPYSYIDLEWQYQTLNFDGIYIHVPILYQLAPFNSPCSHSPPVSTSFQAWWAPTGHGVLEAVEFIYCRGAHHTASKSVWKLWSFPAVPKPGNMTTSTSNSSFQACELGSFPGLGNSI